MRAGRLRNRVEFQRPVSEVSPIGESTNGWEFVCRRWAEFVPYSRKAGETVAAGRLEAVLPGTLTCRFSKQLAEVDESFRVVIDGKPYQIRAIYQTDMRDRMIEMTVEAGVATGDAPAIQTQP